MLEQQQITFDVYEMEYKGGMVSSDLAPVPFTAADYAQYQALIDSCFYDMRKALNIRPYGRHCMPLEELLKYKEDIFLLWQEDVLVGAVSCHANEIDGMAVSVKDQRQGYGRKLMEFALNQLQKRDALPIRLTVIAWNQNAVALYQSLGFEVCKEATVEGVNTKDATGNWQFSFTEMNDISIR